MSLVRLVVVSACACVCYYVGFAAGWIVQTFRLCCSVLYSPDVDGWYWKVGPAVAAGLLTGSAAAVMSMFFAAGRAPRQGQHTISARTAAAILGAVILLMPVQQYVRAEDAHIRAARAGYVLSSPYGSLGTLRSLRGRSVLEDAARRGGDDAPSALNALLRIPGGRGRVGRLAADSRVNVRVRVLASMSLLRAGIATADEERVLTAALADPDSAIRLFVLSQFRQDKWAPWPPHVRDWFASRLDVDPSADVRKETLAALADMGMRAHPQACAKARALLDDPDRDVRRLALYDYRACFVTTYGEDGAAARREIAEALRPRLEHEPNLELMLAAAEVLGSINDESAGPVARAYLTGGAAGKSAENLRNAILALKGAEGRRAMPVLWTFSRCGSTPDEIRRLADGAIAGLYPGVDGHPPIEYQRNSSSPAPLLPEYCP